MLLSAVCNGKVPCVLCDRMLTFLRLYSICGNLRGSVTHWYSTALQFRQMIYFIRLFRHPFRRKATMASFCCRSIPRSYDHLFFLSVFYQISSLTASDWPRFFKIGFNRQVEEGIMGNWSMRRRMMEPLWMTANQEPTVSPTNRRISAWCAAGRQEKPRRHSPALRRLGGCCKG